MVTFMPDGNPVQMEPLLTTKKLILMLAYITGFQCTEPGWKFNILSAITIFNMFNITLCLAYSVIIGKDIFQQLETLCCFGVSAPSIFKLYSVAKAPMKVRALWDFGVSVHHGNTEGRRSLVLYESAVYTFFIVKSFALFFILSSLLFVLYPIYEFIDKKEKTLLVNIFVPFVDATPLRGYILTMLYQLIISSYGIFGNMAYDLFLAMMVSNYQGIVSIWECQLEALIEINRRKKTPKNQAYRRAFLRNMYIQLLDAMDYVNSLDASYGSVIGFQVIASASSIVLALFSIVANDWGGGYGFVVFSFTAIFTFCCMGTMVNNQNQRLYTMIYDIPWYEFDEHDKRVIKYMLMLSQNANEMQIGPFAPLNVETATNIVQSVFSYYTMMISFLEE